MPDPDPAGDDARSGRFEQRVLGPGREPDPRFSLANERTFLAWIRTALTLLGGGSRLIGGARTVERQDWERRGRLRKAVVWIAYGIVRVAMGVLGYGGNEWFRAPRRRHVDYRPPGGG